MQGCVGDFWELIWLVVGGFGVFDRDCNRHSWLFHGTNSLSPEFFITGKGETDDIMFPKTRNYSFFF